MESGGVLGNMIRWLETKRIGFDEVLANDIIVAKEYFMAGMNWEPNEAGEVDWDAEFKFWINELEYGIGYW